MSFTPSSGIGCVNCFKKCCSLNCAVFQEAVKVADVVLWAALYPVLSDSSLALGKY